ncbi:MAG: BtrH N-terminal domain-containing protein [Desulfobulbaceae bacterium]|jgi:hypothetical protein|nr:BtrH N-terminal domain-containing protein [Desulfobulbaceae bacterium]
MEQPGSDAPPRYTIRMINAYVHRHAAHCESGVVRALLEQAGLPLSEAMVFGLSRSLVFVHLPFIKIGGQPLTSYRMPPKWVIRGIQKSLAIQFTKKTFRDAQKGMEYLDARLAEGKIAGVQTSVFWLPYFPDEMRFHFNAHNLIAYGKDGDEYLIGDPVFAATVRCDSASLLKARFIKGMLSPNGFVYHLDETVGAIDITEKIRPALKSAARMMTGSPLPFVGVRGIHFLARRIRKLAREQPKHARLFLGNIIRMQEEIGTGGAGFRFLYASFLQESAALLNEPFLRQASSEMTVIGDEWRAFALLVARFIKNQEAGTAAIGAIAAKLDDIAHMEKNLFDEIKSFA